jgi:hypothetical protein
MNWFFVTLPLVGLAIASVSIPHLVPAVRQQRAVLTVGRAGSNGRGVLSPRARHSLDRG